MIRIRELDENHVKDLNTMERRFSIHGKLVLSLKDDDLTYTIVDVPQGEKSYSIDEIDYTAYLDDRNKRIYLAFDGNRVVGQIILRKNWNNYAYIEDILVDGRYRSRGIGQALLSNAITWAKKEHLAGIMLETQNNNVAACELYEKCGFKLGGFDRYLYKGLKETDEIALYWYYFFETEEI